MEFKQRLAGILAADVEGCSRLIIMAVTSRAARSATANEVVVTAWQQAGLLKASVVKPVIATIEKQLVRRKLGRLAKEDRQQLQNALRHLLGE